MKALLQLALITLTLSTGCALFCGSPSQTMTNSISMILAFNTETMNFQALVNQFPMPSSFLQAMTAAKAAPLIISLHGLGRSHDWLMGYHGLLDQAEANGYIVVTPLGYIRRGWYGSRELDDMQDAQRSEQDVMNVLQLMRDEFSVDSNRIYLWGHSMGGAGTYHIAAKYPDIFAGLGVAAPAPEADAPMNNILNNIKHLPIFVLQGDEDAAVPVERTRAWVAKMQELGMQHVYVEIPGGDHSLLISQDAVNMQKFVDFFNIVRKQY